MAVKSNQMFLFAQHFLLVPVSVHVRIVFTSFFSVYCHFIRPVRCWELKPS